MNLLSKINWTGFSYVLIILGALAIIFTALILIVNKFCAVDEDPKITAVKDNLAGANCGGCGYKGCADLNTRIWPSTSTAAMYSLPIQAMPLP